MILTSKQLEELENVHDATGALSEADEEGGKEEGAEAALDWRLQLIEEAGEAIKHAKARPLDESMMYDPSSLLFDRETRRFGRVMVSVPGYLRIEYLNGGDREWGLLDAEGFLTEFGSQRPVSDLADQLGVSYDEVMAELDRLGIPPLEEPERTEEASAAEAAPAVDAAALIGSDATKAEQRADAAAAKKPARKKAAKGEAHAKVNGAKAEGVAASEPASEVPAAQAPAAQAPAARAPAAQAPGKAAKKKGAAQGDANALDLEGAEPAQAAALKPQDAPKKPKSEPRTGPNGEDPNSYIKKLFKKMSNRELSAATGLSEHTIRRKLGEWGLKRKK